MPPRRAQTDNEDDDHNDAPPQNQAKVVEQFRRYDPPKFSGREAIGFVEGWIRTLERTFKLLACTDGQRVACAEYQLVEDADRWWEGYWRTRTEGERDALTWTRFKEIVTTQYYPRFYRDQMEREFLDLTQGDMSVIEYERKFDQLGRFATHLINDDAKKAQRFLGGLRPGIRHILTGHGDLSYGDTVRRAQGIAASQDMERKVVDNAGKRKWQEPSHGNDKNQNSGKNVKFRNNQGPSQPNVKPFCAKCDRNHFGECLFGQRRCYRCGATDHLAPDCPKTKNQPPKGQARTFAMNKKDDEGN